MVDVVYRSYMNILLKRPTVVNADSTAYCTNYLKGFIPKLYILRGNIEIKYEPCEQKKLEDERREAAKMISSMHMPKDVLKATLKDLAD